MQHIPAKIGGQLQTGLRGLLLVRFGKRFSITKLLVVFCEKNSHVLYHSYMYDLCSKANRENQIGIQFGMIN